MKSFGERVVLGRTGLRVSRVGLGSSYGAGTAAFERAFERGVNYFYWGSRRRGDMGKALRNIGLSHREDLVFVVQSYSRVGWMVGSSLESALRKAKTDYADVLLLGWFNSPPPPRIIDAALAARERGLVRHVALSSHHRALFPTIVDDERYAIWHLRYNAVHRGAESEVFPVVEGRESTKRPGVVSYTSTRWGHLCDPKRTPEGDRTPTGTDCLRFALTSGAVDVAISGPASEEHMDETLAVLDSGPMSDEELAWMRRVGDHIYGRDLTSDVRDGVAAS